MPAYRATTAGVIVEANDALTEFMDGLDPTGTDLSDLVGDHQRDRVVDVVGVGGRVSGAAVRISADGYERRAMLHAWPVAGTDIIEGVLEDMTDWHILQGELRTSVERFRHAFGRGSIGMSLVDVRTREFAAVNDAICDLLGYSEQELLGMNLEAITHPDDRASDKQHTEALLSGEIDVFDLEKRFLRSDGSWVWTSVSVTLVRDAAGAPSATMGRVLDISDRKLAEADAQFKATVLEHIGTAVLVVDLDGRITYWSPGAERLYQWPASEALGRPILDLTVPDGAALQGEVEAALTATGVWDEEVTVQRRDGTRFEAHVVNRVVMDGDGEPLGVVGIVHDLTQSKQLERELREIAASKDEFIASASHELRTPLTAVVGFAELLREAAGPTLDTDSLEMLNTIAREAGDLAYIVEDLLIAARDDLDRLEVGSEVVVVAEQVTQVLASLGMRLRLTGVDGIVTGDPTRIRQIVRNLLSNAVRYGGDDIRVSIEAIDDTVRLTVVDDGPGVADDNVVRIFEPYWRERRERGSAIGIGLGLPISRLLAEAMGGDLGYSRVDGDTRFTLTLPAA